MNPFEPFVALLVIGGLLGLLVTLLRGTPIGLSGLARLGARPTETTTRFHWVGLIVLALVAIGDGLDSAESVNVTGTPSLVLAALFGALCGLLRHKIVYACVFFVLGVAAGFANMHGLFQEPGRGSLALAVLVPLLLGVLVGMTVPGGRGPDTVLGKLLAALTFARFAVAPFDIDVVTAGPAPDTTRIVVTLVVSVVAGALLALPGPGVAVLLGVGVGLLAVYGTLRTEFAAFGFAYLFFFMWMVGAALRTRFGSRTVGR